MNFKRLYDSPLIIIYVVRVCCVWSVATLLATPMNKSNLNALLARVDALQLRQENVPVNADVVVPLKTPRSPFALDMLEGKPFVRVRDEQVEVLVALFDRRVFDNRLRGALESVEWNKRLNTTAGTTKLKSEGARRSASIELATKVIDSTAKLINTLCHELW
jgi:hypothetical protein